MPSRIRGAPVPAVAMISRPISWIAGTPMFPPPALSPHANPFLRSGKKVLMLVIEEARFASLRNQQPRDRYFPWFHRAEWEMCRGTGNGTTVGDETLNERG